MPNIPKYQPAPKMPSYQPASPTYHNNQNDNRNDNRNYNDNNNNNENYNKNLNNNNNYNRNEQSQSQNQHQNQSQSLYNNINIENKNVTYVKNHFSPPKPKFHYTPRPTTPPPVTPPPPQIIYMPQPYPIYPPQPTYPTYPTQPPTYPPVQPPVDYGYPPPVDYGSSQPWDCGVCIDDGSYWNQPPATYPAWEPEAPQWVDYAPTAWETPGVNINNNNNAGMIWAEDTASTAATGFQVDPEYEDQAMHDMLITKYGHSPEDVEAFYNEFYPVHPDRLGDAYFGIERECKLRFGRSSKDAKKYNTYTRMAQEIRKEYGIGINSYRDF